MGQTFSKSPLSQTVRGQGIAAPATGAAAVHRSGTNTNIASEVWLYCVNYSTATQTLNIHWSETSAGSIGAGSLIKATIPVNSGPILVIPGLVLFGGTPELWINVSASAASALVVYGYVNKITSTSGF